MFARSTFQSRHRRKGFCVVAQRNSSGGQGRLTGNFPAGLDASSTCGPIQIPIVRPMSEMAVWGQAVARKLPTSPSPSYFSATVSGKPFRGQLTLESEPLVAEFPAHPVRREKKECRGVERLRVASTLGPAGVRSPPLTTSGRPLPVHQTGFGRPPIAMSVVVARGSVSRAQGLRSSPTHVIGEREHVVQACGPQTPAGSGNTRQVPNERTRLDVRVPTDDASPSRASQFRPPRARDRRRKDYLDLGRAFLTLARRRRAESNRAAPPRQVSRAVFDE